MKKKTHHNYHEHTNNEFLYWLSALEKKLITTCCHGSTCPPWIQGREEGSKLLSAYNTFHDSNR